MLVGFCSFGMVEVSFRSVFHFTDLVLLVKHTLFIIRDGGMVSSIISFNVDTLCKPWRLHVLDSFMKVMGTSLVLLSNYIIGVVDR